MPTEYERSVTSPTTVTASEIKENSKSTNLNEDFGGQSIMESGGDMSTSQTSTTSNGSSSCNGGRKTSITAPDPTAYVAKARVTRPTPPPPPYNPMQFVQIKPCNLYQTAQEQLKKAEEVKKIKEIRKEEPEDWQNNLDNWKSSRRKRVEHIIDRVVEVKKLELEEHDRTRRKSKTFSEMIEERGERSGGRGLNKLASLAVYAEDEANDLSDLGIGTSSASGKSSLSEDYDNNSVMSDNAAELDKAINNSTHHKPTTTESTTREYISSPGYETSSSTAPASSPDPCEYTYEGAIQDYKQRVSRAASGLTSMALNKLTNQQQQNSKESTPERPLNKETAYPPRRGSKIEDRLMGFEVQSPSEECVEKNKVDVPKIDISKRKEIFESTESQTSEKKSQLPVSSLGVPRVTLRDRFKVQETNSSETLTEQPKKELKRLSGDITSIKERLQSLEQQQQQNLVNGANGAIKTTANKLVDIPVPPLKERLSSLQNAVTKEEVRKPPVVLVDARQLEIMKSEEAKAQLNLKETKQQNSETINETLKELESKPNENKQSNDLEEIDKDDSGIHTADDVDLEERVHADILKKEQELKLNAAIEALAQEEKQLSEAANAVNQIEAEFEELSLGSVSLPALSSKSTNASSAAAINNDHMEYSVSSTNPQTFISSSPSNDISNTYINTNSSSQSSGSPSSVTVKGLDFKSASNLRRKPTNEMVHAKNLLKIFKETFQNDIELDEHEVSEENETKNIKDDTLGGKVTDLSLNIKTQIFENSKIVKDLGNVGVLERSPESSLNKDKVLALTFDSTGSSVPNSSETSAPTTPSTNSPQAAQATTKMSTTTSPTPNTAQFPQVVEKVSASAEDFEVLAKSSLKDNKILALTSASSNSSAPNTSVSTTPNPNSSQSIQTTSKMSATTSPTPNSAQSPAEDSEIPAASPKISPSSPMSASMIPRCMAPIGKPPMSPQTKRSTTKFLACTPPGSPTLARKNDSQFSINGRVEIFNSKTMTSPLPNHGNIVKPTTPTMTTKKTQLPYINAPKTRQSNNILLPMQQLPQEATTKQQQQQSSTTVIEPLSTTATTTSANITTAQEKTEQLKSMPSQQMVNEPQTLKLDGETYQQHPHHNSEAVKQQQQQQQQPEIVMCAPPITIVNPDELPKPNTVKNLSSCFQQKSMETKTIKPLPRSRIPHSTPPPSPVLPRRHICYSSENSKEDIVELSPVIGENEKKLSLASCSSTSSSSSTVSTVIDNSKKLSLLSNTSSNSGEELGSIVQTAAQVHNAPERQDNSKDLTEIDDDPEVVKEVNQPAKILDKQATHALVEEMIKVDSQNRTLILNSKDLKPKGNEVKPLAPLKLNLNKTQDTPLSSSSTPIEKFLENVTPITSSSSASPNLPFTSPLAPLHSPKSELFRTTTPLVVSTLYDKYQPTPSAPTNQRGAPLAPLKPTKPIDTFPSMGTPAEIPPLLDCTPNESTLYKLASSAPHSPTTPASLSSEKNLAVDSALCNSLLTSLAVTPDLLKRQHTVEEDLCEKVDKETLPFHQGSTGFKDISKMDIKRCDGLTPSRETKLQGSTPKRQITIEEELCQKLDIHALPDGKQQPITGFKCISPTEIRKCDNFFATGSEKPSSKPNSKPNSPIMQARAAHSKALIETCEKIIAEERLASEQLKSSLPSSPGGTPVMPRKSKIPKPITSCCKATESLNEADLKDNTAYYSQPSTPRDQDNSGVIARMHVVETQIKVTTTTPPASPKVATKPQASPQPAKKTKNIFDFLKKNFGVGGHSNKEEIQAQETALAEDSSPATPSVENKALVLTEEELQDLEKVKYDEVHTYDNSKFYIPASALCERVEEEVQASSSPPLPKTPAPVNIEITRKIITNEILEDGKTEQDLTKEIDDLLDDELNKLNHEIAKLEKADSKK